MYEISVNKKISFAGIPGFRDGFFQTLLEWLVVKSIISDHFIFTGITLIMVRSMTEPGRIYVTQSVTYQCVSWQIWQIERELDYTPKRLIITSPCLQGNTNKQSWIDVNSMNKRTQEWDF